MTPYLESLVKSLRRQGISIDERGSIDVELSAGVQLTANLIVELLEYGGGVGSEDKARLDFLDRLNVGLNERFGTTYRWSMVINHNVNRLCLGKNDEVNLHDMDASGLVSCRDAIDRERKRLGAAR